jgi:hypothetical protein
MENRKSKIEYALECAARGWRVMPLHHIEGGVCTCHKATCRTPAKHPRILDPLNRATTDEAQLREWWSIWPKANIGVATGEKSKVIALDVDPRNGGNETLKKILTEHGELPEKVAVRTGGKGFHLLFEHPGGHWPNTQSSPDRPSPIGQGLDFRGDGGLIVAVGSEHISGGVYEWLYPPNGHLPKAPQWLLDRLRNRRTSTVVVGDGESSILEGSRHPALRAWACQMRGKGMSKAGIRAALFAENAARFAEPKPDDEVERLVEWVCQFAPGDVPHWQDEEPDTPETVSADHPGLVSIRDVQPAMDKLYNEGARRGLSVGWPSLDEFYSVHPGDLTVMCAAPSAGKTTLGLNFVANMAVSHDWKIAICSTENKIEMMFADLAGMIAGSTYYGNFRDRMSLEEKHYVDQFIFEHFRLVTASAREPFTLQYVLSHAKAMNADGVIVDPFGALALPSQQGRNDSRVIRDLLHGLAQPFLKDTQMHLWLMVHTTKLPLDSNGDIQMPTPYNATDSAGFFNVADFFLGMRRPKSKGGKITEVAIQKVRDRFSGAVGQVEFAFDYKTGRYLDLLEAMKQTATDSVGDADDGEAVEF